MRSVTIPERATGRTRCSSQDGSVGPSHSGVGVIAARRPAELERRSRMADYHYVSTWQLQAPIEQVWAALNDLEHLPVWYRGVQQAREVAPGDPQGVGRRVRYVIKGRLPLRLAFEATTIRSVPPRDQDLRAEGELAGTGRGALDQRGGGPAPPGGASAGPGPAGRGRAGRDRPLVAGPAGRGHHRSLHLGCEHDQAM